MNCKGKKKQFEVTFKGDKFPDEYGFGINPPAVLYSKNKKCLRKELAPRLNKDKVKIKSIKEA